MTGEDSALARLRMRFRGLERPAIVVYLLGLVAIFAVLLFSVWSGDAERVVAAYDARWTARVERAEALLISGDFETASAHLEALDRDFPARYVQHRLDTERERVLTLLGRCHIALDRRSRAIDVLTRLVEFDPRNHLNHLELARALQHFDDDDAADEAYVRVLEIHPSHYPSVFARIQMRFEAGEFEAVPDLFEAYLDAYLLPGIIVTSGAQDAPTPISLDRIATTIEVSVDGRFHDIDVPIQLDAGEPICFAPRGFSIEIAWIELVPPLIVGETRREPAVRIEDPDFDLVAMERTAQGRYVARDLVGNLCLEYPRPEPRVARLRMRLRLFKHVEAELWDMVERSYRNALADDRLHALQERVVVGGASEAGTEF